MLGFLPLFHLPCHSKTHTVSKALVEIFTFTLAWNNFIRPKRRKNRDVFIPIAGSLSTKFLQRGWSAMSQSKKTRITIFLPGCGFFFFLRKWIPGLSKSEASEEWRCWKLLGLIFVKNLYANHPPHFLAEDRMEEKNAPHCSETENSSAFIKVKGISL